MMRSLNKIEDLLRNYISVLCLLGKTSDKAAVVRARKLTEYGIRWYYMHRLANDGNDDYSRLVLEHELRDIKKRLETDRTLYELNFTLHDNHVTIHLRTTRLIFPVEFTMINVYFDELTQGEEDATWDKLNNGDVT